MASSDSSTPVKDQAESSGPISCAKGCGFFGNPATGNMCSKCFKQTCQTASAPKEAATLTAVPAAPAAAPAQAPPAQASLAAPAPAEPAPVPPDVVEPVELSEPDVAAEQPVAKGASSTDAAAPTDITPASAVGAVRPAEEAPQEEEPPKKVQANTSRCWTCNRKIGLLGFQCKCEYYFCSEHRYSDRHECAFDYKAQGKQLLTKANPTIAPAKMDAM